MRWISLYFLEEKDYQGVINEFVEVLCLLFQYFPPSNRDRHDITVLGNANIRMMEQITRGIICNRNQLLGDMIIITISECKQ